MWWRLVVGWKPVMMMDDANYQIIICHHHYHPRCAHRWPSISKTSRWASGPIKSKALPYRWRRALEVVCLRAVVANVCTRRENMAAKWQSPIRFPVVGKCKQICNHSKPPFLSNPVACHIHICASAHCHPLFRDPF